MENEKCTNCGGHSSGGTCICEMSDEIVQKLSDGLGISTDEVRKKLDSGEIYCSGYSSNPSDLDGVIVESTMSYTAMKVEGDFLIDTHPSGDNDPDECDGQGGNDD